MEVQTKKAPSERQLRLLTHHRDIARLMCSDGDTLWVFDLEDSHAFTLGCGIIAHTNNRTEDEVTAELIARRDLDASRGAIAAVTAVLRFNSTNLLLNAVWSLGQLPSPEARYLAIASDARILVSLV